MTREQLAKLEQLNQVKPEKIIRNTEYGIQRLNKAQREIWWKEGEK